ncbi:MULTISPECIES: ribokinase [unclassified Luteimonas]
MNAMPRTRVLVAGSANLDFVVRAPRAPAPGETVLGGGLQTFPGGKGANQAVACARAGDAPTTMLVALGDDAPGARLRESLRDAGVALVEKRAVGAASGVAFICIADSGENSIVVAPGANDLLAAEDLPPLDGISHLLLQLETPLASVTAYAECARAAGVTVVLNAAPARVLSPRLLAAIDILVVNEGELAMLAGDTADLEAALRRLPVPCAIVTLGSAGCVARAGAAILRQHAFAVDVVDTTAAGDTFCGALVAALARGDALAHALREASAASALACITAGAQSSIPTRAAVLALLDAAECAHRADGTFAVLADHATRRAPGAASLDDMAPG